MQGLNRFQTLSLDQSSILLKRSLFQTSYKRFPPLFPLTLYPVGRSMPSTTIWFTASSSTLNTSYCPYTSKYDRIVRPAPSSIPLVAHCCVICRVRIVRDGILFTRWPFDESPPFFQGGSAQASITTHSSATWQRNARPMHSPHSGSVSPVSVTEPTCSLSVKPHADSLWYLVSDLRASLEGLGGVPPSSDEAVESALLLARSRLTTAGLVTAARSSGPFSASRLGCKQKAEESVSVRLFTRRGWRITRRVCRVNHILPGRKRRLTLTSSTKDRARSLGGAVRRHDSIMYIFHSYVHQDQSAHGRE